MQYSMANLFEMIGYRICCDCL